MQSIFLQLPFYSRWSVSPSSGNEKLLYNRSPALTHDIFFGNKLPTDHTSNASSQLSRTTRLKNRLAKKWALNKNTTANDIVKEWESTKGRIEETSRPEIFKTLNQKKRTLQQGAGLTRQKKKVELREALRGQPQSSSTTDSAPTVGDNRISMQQALPLTRPRRKQRSVNPLTAEKRARLEEELSEIYRDGKAQSVNSFQQHNLWSALNIRGILEGKQAPYPQRWVDEAWERKRQGH